MKWLETWVAFRDAHSFESSVVVWFAHALLLVLIAWLIGEVMVKRFAAIRYGIWIIACFSLLALAIVTVLASPLAISLRVLPEKDIELADRELPVLGGEPRQAASVLTKPITSDKLKTGSSLAETEMETAPSSVIDERHASASSASIDEDVVIKREPIELPALLVSIYALGVLFFMIRIVVSCIGLSRLKSRSSQLSESQLELARRCAREIGLSSCPTYLQSDEVKVPMAIGIIRPTVVLPTSIEECDFTLQRHCILHELIHIHHHDGLWNLLGEITKTIYWFHPAVFLARRKLAQAREYVADDHTLRLCNSPAAYSRTLLTLIQLSRDESNALLGIGATTHVERRIRRVLQPRFQPRRLPRWVLLFPAVVLIAFSTCAFQIERAIAQRPAGTGDSTETSDATAETTKRSSTDTPVGHAVSLYEKFDRVTLDDNNLGNQYLATVVGQVADKSGKVSDAIVLLRLARRYGNLDEPIPVVARARTDKEGRYKAQFTHSNLSASSTFNRVEILVADKKGRLAMDVRQITNARPADFSARVDLSLLAGQTLSATIQSEDGQPLGGVSVSVQKAIVTCEDVIRGDPFAGTSQPDPLSSTTHEFRFPSDRIRPTSTTKEDGRFDFSGAVGVILSVEKEGLFRRTPGLYAKTPPLAGYQDAHRSPAVIRLADEIAISTHVTDQAGNRIQDFKIEIRNINWGQRRKEDGSIVTAESYLLESANDEGQFLVSATFPEESGLTRVQKWIDVEALLRSRHLELKTEKGIWISGRVVKHDTGFGLKGVSVRWNDTSDNNSYSPHWAVTDANGNWKLLAPRRRGVIAIDGIVPGYDIGGGIGVNKPQRELIQEVVPGDATELSAPNFRVRPIRPRTVMVVDTNGRPVSGADVSAEHTTTVRGIDGREYSLNQSTLAPRTQSDDGGKCVLKLTQTTWKDGVVKVSKTFIPDDARSNRDVLIQTGHAKIEPNSDQPIKVVVHDHVHLRGQVLVDGKPHPTIRVGLATRAEKTGPFNKYNNGYFKTSNGLFEFQMDPTGEYAIMLCLLADESNGERHYYHQTPIAKSNSKTWDAGTIDIRLNQLKEISSD